jgi:glutamate racemase
MDAIFDLYDRGEIKLTRSPDKTLLFQTQELQSEQVQNIVDDIAEKVQKRLAGFEAFVELIEAGADVKKVVQQRFGCT